MATVYLDEPGAHLAKRGERLIVEVDNQVRCDLKLQEVERVVVCDHGAVTFSALESCLGAGIELAFVSPGGRLLGRLQAVAAGPDGDLRRDQWAVSQQPPRRLCLARAAVSAKLEALRHRLVRWTRDNPVLAPALAAVEQGARAVPAADEAALLGVEGAASKAYFAALAQVLKPPWTFPGRLRHPAPDPVNALLGFCYALVENEVTVAAVSAGLDPDIGLLHVSTRHRASLALDLLEEFRPLVADAVALRLLNRGQLTAADFQPAPEGDGVWLTERGRQTVFAEMEARLRTAVTLRDGSQGDLRALVRRQARDFATGIRQLADLAPDVEPATVALAYQSLASRLR